MRCGVECFLSLARCMPHTLIKPLVGILKGRHPHARGRLAQRPTPAHPTHGMVDTGVTTTAPLCASTAAIAPEPVDPPTALPRRFQPYESECPHLTHGMVGHTGIVATVPMCASTTSTTSSAVDRPDMFGVAWRRDRHCHGPMLSCGSGCAKVTISRACEVPYAVCSMRRDMAAASGV